MLIRLTILMALITADIHLHILQYFYGQDFMLTYFWFESMMMYDLFWMGYWGVAGFIVLTMLAEYTAKREAFYRSNSKIHKLIRSAM